MSSLSPLRRRALVTGANGFVGSHLVPYLHQKGWKISASFHRKRGEFPFPVQWIKADLTDAKQTLALIQSSQPRVIFHLAGFTLPKESWKEPDRTVAVNVGSALNLMEGLLRTGLKARILLMSSAQVYGSTFYQRKKANEGDLASPVSPYAGSKLLMELAALQYAKACGLDVVIARPFNQVGRGQHENFVFSDFCRQVALIEKDKKDPVVYAGNVDLVRDFLPVEDAVRAYHLLALKGKRGEIYNVGSGKGTALRWVLAFLRKESGVFFRFKSVRERRQKNEFSHAVVNISKLRRLGWRPKVSLRQSLRDLLTEWREKV